MTRELYIYIIDKQTVENIKKHIQMKRRPSYSFNNESNDGELSRSPIWLKAKTSKYTIHRYKPEVLLLDEIWVQAYRPKWYRNRN